MQVQKIPTPSEEYVGGVLKEIKEFLDKLVHEKNLVQYYWEASKKAEELILCILGEENYHFPVDVERLARKLGIWVEEDRLDEFSGGNDVNKRIGQILMQEDVFTGERYATIYIEKNISPATKRYAIAHELVHYIIHREDRNFYEDYCLMPMCPIRIEEIVADIFATFLLIPVRLFFEEFHSYVRQRTQQDNVPIATESWIRHLSERSLVPEYYVAYGYQQLRYVGYLIYWAWNYAGEKDDATEVQGNTQEELIGQTSESVLENPEGTKPDEEDPEREKAEEIKVGTKEYFKEDMMRLLFQ